MRLLHVHSLSETVNAVNDAFFFGRTIPADTRRRVAAWIASRQALPGAYGGLFAGFPEERTSGIHLFTGEHVTSASARHILGEEACRALLLLRSRDPDTAAALERATAWISGRVRVAGACAPRNNEGVFCCGKCTVGLWRNILAGGLDRPEHRLQLGLRKLREQRNAEGEWRTFPFWYTVLALTEMDSRAARAELKHAAPRIEAEAMRPPKSTPYAARRNALARRALERLDR
jgi:hypothetical protein